MPNLPILENLWIIPLLPLLGAAINGLFGAKWSNSIVNTVALSSTGLSFLAAVLAVPAVFTPFYPPPPHALPKTLFLRVVSREIPGRPPPHTDPLPLAILL